MQRGRPSVGARCIVVSGGLALGFGLLSGPLLRAESGDALEDFAEVYVDQYFAPDEDLLLNETGKRKSTALAFYSLGRSFEAQGRALEAVEAYRTVLENAPDQHFLARKTAYLLARNGSNDEALELLETNLEKNPDEPFAHISLSEYLATYRANDTEARGRAFRIIEEALERFPGEPAVYEHLVRLYLVNDRRDDARTVMEGVVERENPDPEFWLRMGKLSGRVWPSLSSAEPNSNPFVNDLYGKALSQAGNRMEIVESVADYYHATRQFDRAIQAYTRIIVDSPDRLDVREKLAGVYGGKGDEEKMLQTLKEIVEIDPENVRIHEQLARIYMNKEDFRSAIPHLRKSLAISKGSATEYNALARMMIESEEHEVAIEFLEEAAYLFPEIPDFPFLLTFPLGRLEKWEDSVKQFETVVELAGEKHPEMLNESFFFRYAAAHERAGNLEEAEKLFEKTIELISRNDPNDQNQDFTATVYNYLGYMWLENDKNVDEAGELIKTAADLDPESGAIADSLGWFYFKKKKFAEARDELLRAEQMIEEPDAVILDHIGQAFFELGEREKAIEYLERAVELEPEKEEYSKRLGEYRAAEAKEPAKADEPGKADVPAPESKPGE